MAAGKHTAGTRADGGKVTAYDILCTCVGICRSISERFLCEEPALHRDRDESQVQRRQQDRGGDLGISSECPAALTPRLLFPGLPHFSPSLSALTSQRDQVAHGPPLFARCTRRHPSLPRMIAPIALSLAALAQYACNIHDSRIHCIITGDAIPNSPFPSPPRTPHLSRAIAVHCTNCIMP